MAFEDDGEAASSEAVVEGDIMSYPTFVLIELTGILVVRTEQELQELDIHDFDGSSKKCPFYVVPGAIEFLQQLASEPPRVLAVMTTRLNYATCEPMVDYLRQEANLKEHELLLFDVTSMSDHEDQGFSSDRHSGKQCDLCHVCEQCCAVYGRRVDFHQSVVVITDLRYIRHDQEHHALYFDRIKPNNLIDRKLHCSIKQRFENIQKEVSQKLNELLGTSHSCVASHTARQEVTALHHDTVDPPMIIAEDPVPLVAIDLNCLLLFRSETGRLQGGDCIGHDGTDVLRPFYANTGAVTFLNDMKSHTTCVLAVMTSMQPHSCKPMANWLQENTELGGNLLCFDASCMRNSESGDTFPDGRPRKQRDLNVLCDKCEEIGHKINRDMSIMVVSCCKSVRTCDEQHAFVLPPFAADDVVDKQRQALAATELKSAFLILKDALATPPLPRCWPEVSCSRAIRPVEEQCRPEVSCSRAMRHIEEQRGHPSLITRSLSGRDWQQCGNWACAKGVVADGWQVQSQAKGWAGARYEVPVKKGMHAEQTISILEGPVVRVGWSASFAREVGVDDWGWGYGGTAKKSHAKRFEDYGKEFGMHDAVTSVLDRTGDFAKLTFLLNGKPVTDEPAYLIPEEDLNDMPLFFAICGKSGFKVKLMTEDADVMNTCSMGGGNLATNRAPQISEAAVVPSPCSCRVLVLTFNRHSQEFDKALLSSDLAKRASDRGAKLQPQWANGAKIFVENLSASDAEESRVELLPRHVVVREDEEKDVYEALKSLSYKKRPRLKPSAPKALVPSVSNLSRFQDSVGTGDENTEPDEPSCIFPVKRTFIEIKPEVSPRSWNSWP